MYVGYMKDKIIMTPWYTCTCTFIVSYYIPAFYFSSHYLPPSLPPSLPPPPPDRTIGYPVRLVGGATALLQGRVEVQYNGQWGTMCDDLFTAVDATVVCQQLGYFGVASVAPYLRFGAGPASMPIWLDDVGCLGTESYLSECPNRGWGVHNCVHNEDVGVFCQGEWVCVCVCVVHT